jgi:hypothetical protein
VSISFDANDNNNAVGAATSVDGGVTWQNQKPIIADLASDPRQPFNDKESVTADPQLPLNAYAVWDRLVLVPCGPAGRSHNMPIADDRKWRGASKLAAPGSKSAVGAAPVLCFEGPTFFSRTMNGGVTWSPPKPIVSNAPDEQTIANQIVVDHKTGRLYDFYVYFAASGRVTVEDIFSDDKGATWSPRQTVNDLDSVGIHDPQMGAPARTGDVIPTPALDPKTGQLYVIWQDNRFNTFGEDDTVISTAPPMTGLTGSWSNPVKVDLSEDRAGFTGGIKVDDLGQVGVDYYSLRHPDLARRALHQDHVRSGSNHRTHSHLRLLAADARGRTLQHDGSAFRGHPRVLRRRLRKCGDRPGREIVPHLLTSTNCDDTNCTAPGNPVGAPMESKAPHDPMDVYTNQYYKAS